MASNLRRLQVTGCFLDDFLGNPVLFEGFDQACCGAKGVVRFVTAQPFADVGLEQPLIAGKAAQGSQLLQRFQHIDWYAHGNRGLGPVFFQPVFDGVRNAHVLAFPH